jgi:hypothetical protein
MNLKNVNECLHECVAFDHQHHHTSKTAEKMWWALEKASAIALGIFSAYTNLKLFIPVFLLGISLGIYNYFEGINKHTHSSSTSSCSQGFMEQLTGIKLPAPLSLIANIAITVCHIDHHDTVFVPIVAASIGAWTGQSLMQCGALLYREFTDQSKKLSIQHS